MKKKLINIQILNKELSVVCPEGEKADLYAAAAYLNKKMLELCQNAKSADLDRIAIIAALNITNELLTLRQQSTHQPPIQSQETSSDDTTLLVDNSPL